MLFFCKHCHNYQSVQVDALTKHPEVVAAHYVHLNECEKFTAVLEAQKAQKNTVFDIILCIETNCIYCTD